MRPARGNITFPRYWDTTLIEKSFLCFLIECQLSLLTAGHSAVPG